MGQVNKNLVSHSDHNFALFRFNDQGQICLDDYVIPWVTHFEMQNFARGTAQLNLEIIVRLDKEMTLHEAENQSNNFTDDGISPTFESENCPTPFQIGKAKFKVSCHFQIVQIKVQLIIIVSMPIIAEHAEWLKCGITGWPAFFFTI